MSTLHTFAYDLYFSGSCLLLGPSISSLSRTSRMLCLAPTRFSFSFLHVRTCSFFWKENSIATSESRKSAQLTNHAFVFIVYANIIYIYIHGYKYTNVYNLPSQGVHWTNQPRWTSNNFWRLFTEETWFDFGRRVAMYPNWYENLWKDCHTRIWPQEVTEWAADGFTSIAKLTFLSHSEYLQLLSTKIKYYLIYWSRRALENPCLLRESVCGLHFVDRCSTWRQRGNSMTAASRFWRLADFEAALRLVDVRISELCQGFRLDMPWWWIWWQFEMYGMYHAADSNRTLTLRCMHLVRRWCTVLKELLLKTLPAHCYNIELIASDPASYCTFARGAPWLSKPSSSPLIIANWQCSGRALASSAFCDLQVSAFLGSTRANDASGLSRKAGSASKWLTTACKILQDAAFSRVMSCRCRVSLKSLLAFVQGLESMLKALLQERVLTKVGRLLSDLVGQ